MISPTLVWLCLTASMLAQSPLGDLAGLLPKDAQIIETASIRLPKDKARVLVLWMEGPKRITAEWETAADFLYGDHWFGPTSLSLVDPVNGKLINTVRVDPYIQSLDDKGSFAVPFFTSADPYFVPNPDKDRRGRPVLLHLQDLTGEGIAGQFVLFDYGASGIDASSVWGYSRRSDAVVHYPVEVIQGKFSPVVQGWVTQVFATPPIRPGYWKFTWEPGHGSWVWVDEEVHFDPDGQRFTEKRTIRPYPGYARAFCDLKATSLPTFLHQIQNVAPDFDSEAIQGVRRLVYRTPIRTLESTGIVATFRGEQELLELEW